MNRRQYLAAVSALGAGSLAGCTTADVDSDSGATDAGASTEGGDVSGHDDHEHDHGETVDEASSGGDGGDDGAEGDGDGASYVAEENVELDLNDRFVLDDLDVGIVVTGTERMDPERLETAAPADGDVFVVEMLVENETEDRAELDHDLFWLEGLDPGEDRPDTDLSEVLDDGATGEATRLDPGEKRTLEIAFDVASEFEPRYLWAEKYYVCLV